MGFFKDNKNDFSDVHDSGRVHSSESLTHYFESELPKESNEDMAADSIKAGAEVDEVLESMRKSDTGSYEEEDTDLADETAVITAGLTVTGNLDSTGSIDIFGTVEGDVSCMGKLTVSGTIYGSVGANEVFANDAQIEGNVRATGSVKIGKGTVIIGDLNGTSAVIAGAVKGNIDIEGPVIVDSTAIIVGDIKSKTVQINNGATIEGRCSQCYGDVNTEAVFDISHDKKAEAKKTQEKETEQKENHSEQEL